MTTPKHIGDPAQRPDPAKRGRPPGSVTLTPEIQEQILQRIRGGAWDYVAAESVGISARTFYEWIQRGEGQHPTRPANRKLARFAKEVSAAKASARAAAEIRLFRDNPARWLSSAARTKPDREGWTNPQEIEAAPEVARELEALIRALDEPEAEELGPGEPPWDGAALGPAGDSEEARR